MSTAKAEEPEYYTYADVLSWPENFRAELIEGELYMMAPPLRAHQKIVTKLLFQFESWLKDKSCEVYPAPFGVRLFPLADDSDDTFVEPDLTVICDPAKLDDRGCNGVPDLVAEVLSPSTARYDRTVKFRQYRRAGVREYWLVDPDTKTVEICVLEDGRYVITAWDDTETVPVTVLPGCEIALPAVFAE
jgi:Uma2 family endonuclease